MTDSPNDEPSQVALGINNVRKLIVAIVGRYQSSISVFEENAVLFNHVLK